MRNKELFRYLYNGYESGEFNLDNFYEVVRTLSQDELIELLYLAHTYINDYNFIQDYTSECSENLCDYSIECDFEELTLEEKFDLLMEGE